MLVWINPNFPRTSRMCSRLENMNLRTWVTRKSREVSYPELVLPSPIIDFAQTSVSDLPVYKHSIVGTVLLVDTYERTQDDS